MLFPPFTQLSLPPPLPFCARSWYVLAYMETCGAIRRGETVMQIGMGGGMKAGVNVWRALRDVRSVHPAWRHVAGRPLTEADLPRPVTDPPPPAAAATARGERQHDEAAAAGPAVAAAANEAAAARPAAAAVAAH